MHSRYTRNIHLCVIIADRGWDGWMASPRTWVWVSSGSWWWTGKPGVLQSMGSQRVGHDWATELIADLFPVISLVGFFFLVNQELQCCVGRITVQKSKTKFNDIRGTLCIIRIEIISTVGFEGKLESSYTNISSTRPSTSKPDCHRFTVCRMIAKEKQHFLNAFLCDKHIMYAISFHLHNDSMIWVWLLTFYKWRDKVLTLG